MRNRESSDDQCEADAQPDRGVDDERIGCRSPSKPTEVASDPTIAPATALHDSRPMIAPRPDQRCAIIGGIVYAVAGGYVGALATSVGLDGLRQPIRSSSTPFCLVGASASH